MNKTTKPNIKIHEASQVLEGINRVTQNGFVAYNLAGLITYFNDRLQEVTGWHESEMLGKPIKELFLSNDYLQIKNNTDISSKAINLFTRDGKQLTVEARTTGIMNNDGQLDGYITLLLVEGYNKNLDKAQSEFISTVSHELRTPITSIKGFAATLLQQGSALDEEKKKKYTKIIKDQAERLSRLVEDLLSVSRLESKKTQLTIQPVNLKPILENIAEIVSAKYNHSHKIDTNCSDMLPNVWVDSDRLEQILTNLVDNAVKYSPQANLVEIKIRTCQHNGEEMVRVNVTDHGIGIKEDDQRKIFTKFSRLDNPLTRVTEGTGLGLYISFSLAKLLGGDLKVKSGEGKTTFSLYLPTKFHEGGSIWWD